MISGADSVQAERHSEPEWGQDQQVEDGATTYPPAYEAEPEDLPVSTASRVLAGLLILLAIGWTGFSAYVLTLSWPGPSLPAWAGWIASFCVPLTLLALVWVAFGRSSRREAARFITAVGGMKRESHALEGVLAIVAQRLEENRGMLAGEAARLMSLGDEASDRLGRVTHYLARESAELERKAQALDAAAAAARVDIGALMSDLPRAEEQARAAAAALREAGLGAHERAAALEDQVAALTARSREADENVGGAAQRLGAQITRIETGTQAAAARIDEAAQQMNAAVDGAMIRASDSVEQARSGLDAQGQAMLALVEQSRTAFATAGAEAMRLMAERLDEAGTRIESLAGQLSRQEEATRQLLAGLNEAIADLDTRLSGLGETGDAQSQRLSAGVATLREAAEALQRELGHGENQSSALSGQARELDNILDALAGRLRTELPGALTEVQAQVLQTGAAASAAIGSVEAIRDAATQAAASLVQGEASIRTQRENLDALLASVEQGTRTAEAQLRAVGESAEESRRSSDRILQESGPQLIEALVRVRETAQQAASHAREAIASVIPESVARLADASREAVVAAVTEPVEDQLAELGAAAQRAMAVARQASERLTRQLLVMGETASAVEDRIAIDKAEREENASENLSRRVSLLIEALNSTAIDVGKILSNEVSDTAWASYLRGDRGVFTRRAVRLLDSGEAREVWRHYEEEPEFREQVNRYVHDFETMLRRVLADRDGGTLSVTLLSSDMGKLYVALAQAIDRIRR
jgi:predicted  nucleic acid-binding Zn-ribbon protein